MAHGKYGSNERVSGKPACPSNDRGPVGDTFTSLNDGKASGPWPSTPAPGKTLGLVTELPLKANSSILSSGPVDLPTRGGPSDSPKG